MKPESLQAFTQLQSFGMEELSSEEAAHLLSVIDECPECKGEWVLFYETINTLSHTAHDEVTGERSQNMWLVCLEHANEKHTFSISSELKSDADSEVHPEMELTGQKKTEKFVSDDIVLEKTWDKHHRPQPLNWASIPQIFLAPRPALGLALASFALLVATYFLTPQRASNRSASTPLPATLTRMPASANPAPLSAENAQLAAYATHSNFYLEPISDSVAPQIVSYSTNSRSR